MSKPILKFNDPDAPTGIRFVIIPTPSRINKFKLVTWKIGSLQTETVGYFS